MPASAPSSASLEALIEMCDIGGLDVLHPGGLELTEELAALCRLRPGATVLDVAAGTGESACFLATRYGVSVVGVDASARMVGRAAGKAAGVRNVSFLLADAHRLPFPDAAFDAAICECTLCLLDKRVALAEMVRVARPGGTVAMHDLCWRPNASPVSKKRLAEIEGETPETADGWQAAFEDAGLQRVVASDKSGLMQRWMDETRRRIGIGGQGRMFLTALRTWGIGGLIRVLRSEAIFRDPGLGYVLVAGTKPRPR